MAVFSWSQKSLNVPESSNCPCVRNFPSVARALFYVIAGAWSPALFAMISEVRVSVTSSGRGEGKNNPEPWSLFPPRERAWLLKGPAENCWVPNLANVVFKLSSANLHTGAQVSSRRKYIQIFLTPQERQFNVELKAILHTHRGHLTPCANIISSHMEKDIKWEEANVLNVLQGTGQPHS